MTSIIGMIQRIWKALNPTVVRKEPSPLRFGILGAADIAPIALTIPALNHPEVVVYAIAARSLGRAQTFAKKHNIQKAYGSYQELLDDPEVDAVYNPLPNALHYEWTMKALLAGKHVLNEKPSADTAEETRAMFELAESKGLIMLDAFHYRHHPATLRLKEIVDSGEIGKIKHVTANLELTSGLFKHGNIRFDYDLGGGALMDLGCYTMSAIQYLTSSNPTSVIAATHIPYVPPNAPESYVKNVDRRVEATLAMPSDITATLVVDHRLPPIYGFIPQLPKVGVTVEGELGSVSMYNYVLPTWYHSITVKINGSATRVEKVYKSTAGKLMGKDDNSWTTYRYQLEAFVDKVRGREPAVWVSKEESVSAMQGIEMVYEKIGLGSRPKSKFVVPS